MKNFATLLFFTFFLSISLQNSFAQDAAHFLYVSSEGEIILDGESLGYGANPVVDDSDYAYESILEDGVHVIFNGKDLGQGYRPQISEGKLLYEREVNFKNSIVFNGKLVADKYGKAIEGFDPILKDGHFSFFQQIRADNIRNTLQGRVLVYYDGAYYCDGENSTIKEKFFFEGSQVICEQEIQSDDATKSFIIYNGKVIDEGTNPHVSKKHFAYTKSIDFGDGTPVSVIVFDGKVLGEGYDFSFSEESFIYFRKNIQGAEELIYNGKNLGSFKSKDSIVFKDGHIAFLRDIKKTERQADGSYKEVSYTHVFYDGIDRGIADVSTDAKIESKKVFLAKNHIAFERKLPTSIYESTNTDTDLLLDPIAREAAPKKEIDVSYVVFDGRVRTQIVEGSLRMDDTGTFAFAKMVEVKEEDKEYAKARYNYYLTHNYGENSEKDAEFSAREKYHYIERPFIFKGKSNGSMQRLSQGTPETIVVSDGKVAYVQVEEEEVQYYEAGEQRKRLELNDHVIINGQDQGIGDITSLIMDKGQYAFAQNKNGRLFLSINGKKQAFPGTQVLFLEEKEEKTSSPESSLKSNNELTGILFKKKNRYYIKVSTGKWKRVIPSEKLKNIDTFLKQEVILQGKETTYTLKKSKRKFQAYKVTRIQKAEEKINSQEQTEKYSFYRGSLKKIGTGYYLQGSQKQYRLSGSGAISNSMLDPYIGDTVKLKLEKISGSNLWKVQGISE